MVTLGALTAFWWLRHPSRREPPFGWLTFALIRPTIPAWTAAASC
jgi:hypothetical protein